MLERLGEFRILETLGEGGMGMVYRGHQESLDRDVAIKVLSENIAKNETFVARFQREARAAASLVHPNVIQIYSTGCEGDIHYFAMEYVRGKDLAQLLMEGRSFSLVETVEILIQVAQAMCAAAEIGLVHRDIKPSNIMLTERGQVKITDFGLAKTNESNLTEVGIIVGTANYMSPEQGQGMDLDVRSDIYSLGVVFYELVAGRPPFIADQPAAVLYKHVYEAPVPPSRVHPEVPEAVDRVILHMMQKAPDDRPASPEALLEELRALYGELAGQAYGAGGAVLGSGGAGGQAPSSFVGRPGPAGPNTEAPTLVSSDLRPVNRRAVVADDVGSVRQLLGTILKEKQFEVIEAEDGEAAVQTILDSRPDLVLLDVGIPKLDGIQVLERLHANHVDSKVIVISAHKDRETVARASRFEISGYLAKPVNIHELRERIDEIAGHAAARPPAPAAEPMAESAGAAEAPAVIAEEGTGRFILVCDGQRYSQFLFRQVLEGAGHRVAGVEHPDRALALLEEELPDLLLLSLASDRNEGLRLLATIRKRGWGLPTVTVVDEADREAAETVRALGLGPLLTKPVRLDDLRVEVDRALRDSHQHPKLAMESGAFTSILNRQRITDNAFTVFDFARSLIGAVPPASRPSFETSIREKPARAVCNLVGGVLKRLAEEQDPETAMRYVRNAYRQGDFETRHLCLILLRELLPPEEEAEVLKKIVTDEDYRLRIRVLHRMGELRDEGCAEMAVRFLNDDVWKVRNAAVERIEMLGLRLCIKPLAQFYARAGGQLPDRLRKVLVESRDAGVHHELETLARHGPPEVQEFLAGLFGEMHSRQPAVILLELLRAGHPRTRAAAARSLGRLRNAKTKEGLLEALTDSNGEVQAAVADALRGFQLTPGARALLERLAARKRRIAKSAVKVIARLDSRPDELERMLFALDRLDGESRKVLSLLLSGLYPQENDLRRVVQDLNAVDRNVRRRAAREVVGAIER